MSIKERLAEDIKTAMKAGDKPRVGVLRMLRARVQDAELARRAKAGKDFQLDDPGTIEVLSTYAKQRRESIDSYRSAGRDDLATKEEGELEIIRQYLPQQLSEQELRTLVSQAVEESGATSLRDLGAVMKLLMPKVKGRADGKQVNQLVRERIEGGG